MATENEKQILQRKKKQFLQILRNCNGVVFHACAKSKAICTRNQFYIWCRKDKAFARKVREVREIGLDFAESKLFELMKGVKMKGVKGTIYDRAPDVTAIIFYLKTIGKDRGYVERREETGRDGGAKERVIEYFKVGDQELPFER